MLLNRIREYSIPLILGVISALIWINLSPESYYDFIHTPILGYVNFHFLVNDIFMVFFFSTAGIEIINSLSPGGALNPIKKAMTPLLATVGGIMGPIVIFFLFNGSFGEPSFSNGWGICTATDIALAWLLARIVFGKDHPAISFLLLLAVADDAVGLMIIAIFYPDPKVPVEPLWLLFIVLAMLVAAYLNKRQVRSYVPYILGAGILAWIGMFNAHLHPALSLIFIIPFLPRKGVAVEAIDIHGVNDAPMHSTLNHFEHHITPLVDYGLVFFGISNAGVEFSSISNLTWIIFGSLVVGKTLGITSFTWLATQLKFTLPEGMLGKDVLVAGIIGGMGLTVALFVVDAAYTDIAVQGAAKMGALFTVFTFIFAMVIAKILNIKKR